VQNSHRKTKKEKSGRRRFFLLDQFPNGRPLFDQVVQKPRGRPRIKAENREGSEVLAGSFHQGHRRSPGGSLPQIARQIKPTRHPALLRAARRQGAGIGAKLLPLLVQKPAKENPEYPNLTSHRVTQCPGLGDM
jgi:hypothetical protein